MERTDLQRLSKDELIELVLRLQRPEKTSRTSSKPPSTDKKERRENSRLGGAKLGHEPHNRGLSDHPGEFHDHKPSHCDQCGGALGAEAAMVRDNRHGSVHIFGAICPARGIGAAVIMTVVNTEAMNHHLSEIRTQVASGAHALLICDGAGWHQLGERLSYPIISP